MNAQVSKPYRKKDFWSVENRKYDAPHFRLEKAAQIINGLVEDRSCALLDVGCGPGTLGALLSPPIRYHGIDISIPEPSENLHEFDILEQPIDFDGRRFDFVVAQGLFEYLGDHQAQKLREISTVLADGGTFLTSYVNFDHRDRTIYDMYNNVQPMRDFRAALERPFTIHRSFPTSHNWGHSEPTRPLLRALNMKLDVTVPFVSRKLAVEYFFVCSARKPAALS